ACHRHVAKHRHLVLDNYQRPRARPATERSRKHVAAATAPVKLYVVVLAVNADRSVRVRVCGIDIEATTRWPAGEPLPDVGKSYLVEVDKPDPINGKVLSVSGPLEEGGCPAAVYLPSVTPGLFLTLKDTVNANAAAVTLAQLNETLARRGFLWIGGQSKPDVRVELDCGGAPSPGGWSGGLSYCTRGGTGRVVPSIIPSTPPRSWPIAFPDAADTNGNGFGELSVLAGSPGGFGGFLSHGATTHQIGTGDVLNWRITVGGVESQFPTTLPDVYATVPALVSYRDGPGNSGA